jgi:hypothetical protein
MRLAQPFEGDEALQVPEAGRLCNPMRESWKRVGVRSERVDPDPGGAALDDELGQSTVAGPSGWVRSMTSIA